MNNNEDIKVHPSGAKTSGNLPPYECLTDEFIERCALRMKLGMHYGKHNWVSGATDKNYVLERLRHAYKHLRKAIMEIDLNIPMTDDDLAAVAVNVMFAMYIHPSGRDLPVEIQAIRREQVKEKPQPIKAEAVLSSEISQNKHLWRNGRCTKCGILAEFAPVDPYCPGNNY